MGHSIELKLRQGVRHQTGVGVLLWQIGVWLVGYSRRDKQGRSNTAGAAGQEQRQAS